MGALQSGPHVVRQPAGPPVGLWLAERFDSRYRSELLDAEVFESVRAAQSRLLAETTTTIIDSTAVGYQSPAKVAAGSDYASAPTAQPDGALSMTQPVL